MKNKTNISTWKNTQVPRGKHHNKTATKTTVSLYLNKNLVERARNRRLNLSRVAEQALSSILDYLEPQNQYESSKLSYTPFIKLKQTSHNCRISGASSSARIEHHPPKVGVVGSNPTSPVGDKPGTQ